MSITQQQAQLIAKLRYMGKQYAAGQVARGGAPQKHYLEEAADEIEMMAWALSMNEKTPASAQENADLRNVIQAACIDGLPGLARAWEKYFPNHPITIKGIEQGAGAAPEADVVQPLSDDELQDLAHSAYEEALSFGLSVDTFLRYFKGIRKRAAVQHPQQEQPTRHPGCTAGTDEECTVRRCGDVCTERKQEQPK